MRILIIVIAAVLLVACAENKTPTQAQASAIPAVFSEDGLAVIPSDQMGPPQVGTMEHEPAKSEPFNGGG